MEPQERKLNPSPQLEANIFSRLLFWWTHPIFRLGYQRRLEASDIYDVTPDDSSVKLSNDLGREWEKETYRWKTGGQPSLYKALFRCYGLNVIGIGFFFLLEEAFRIGQAVFLGLLVTYFEAGSKVSLLEAYLYALGWTLTYLFVIIFDNMGFHKSFYFGLKMRVGCTSLIYRKLMRISQHSLHDTNVGNIISLISTDAQRFEQSCLGINYLWIGPLQTVVVVFILWWHLSMGPYSLIGVGVVILLVPAQYLTGRYLSTLRGKLSRLVERRVRIMHEIITGIKTIKMNCWEDPFSSLINSVRSSEWRCLRTLSHWRSANSALYLVSGKVVMLATFVTYVLLGFPTPPHVIFTALALYEVLRASIGLLLPWGIQYFTDALDAIKRIEKFLLLEERNILETTLQQFLGRPPLPEGVSVSLEDFTASWARDDAAFKVSEVNLDIQQARMVVLVGQPGSGRSSLLMGILGELPRSAGYLRTRGRLAYVPQHPWVFGASLRDNVLFGHDLDNQRYHRVLHACGLLPDLQSFSQGDLTLIGETDENLSNSQKAKICLARAAYHDADIYLIDDIFSAIDEKAAIHIFTKCFCGLLNTKTIIYVTTTLSLIRAADQIIILKKGKVQHQGAWEDLKNIGVDFREATGADDGGEPEVDEKIEDGLTKDGLSLTVRRRGDGGGDATGDATDGVNLDFKDAPLPGVVADEDKSSSPVKWATYWSYFKVGGGACGFFTFATLCVLLQVSYILTDWWLFYWSKHQWPSQGVSSTLATFTTTTSTQASSVATLSSIQAGLTENSTSSNLTHSVMNSSLISHRQLGAPTPHTTSNIITTLLPLDGPVWGRTTPVTNVHYFLYIYLGLFVSFLVLALLRALLFSSMAVGACRKLHLRMFRAFLRAPITFFDKFSIGRLLARFSRDMMTLDDALPASLFDCIQFLSLVVGMLLVVGVANFWMLLLLIPLVVVFVFTRRYYTATSRQVKHFEVTARTPVYQHLAHTLEGLWTIRAFQGEERFTRHFDVFMDRHTAAAYTYLAVGRWFALRLDLLTVLLLGLLAVVAVAVRETIDPGLLGLALAHTLSLIGLFQYSVRQTGEVANQMTSLDRIKEICDVPTEADIITTLRPGDTWPQYGIVTFEGVSLAVDGDVRNMLKNVWGCIRAEEKVGVLTQPGGCKKALLAALLRLSEPHGTVRIDGIDISDVGLRDLREKLSVIQQDPTIFGGSVRRNLDPGTRYSDAALWRALGAVLLRDKVRRLPGRLYADLAEHGAHFTLGERQLLSLARAILRNSKVVVFEESCSVLDKRIESLIQYVLRHHFPHKTVIILAQKPQSVVDMDRVMVLDEGRIKEFDSAHSLLQDKECLFYRLIHALPDAKVRRLQKMALDKHENKPYRPPAALSGDLPTQYTRGQNFMPSFQTNRLSGVLSQFTGNRFSTNRF